MDTAAIEWARKRLETVQGELITLPFTPEGALAMQVEEARLTRLLADLTSEDTLRQDAEFRERQAVRRLAVLDAIEAGSVNKLVHGLSLAWELRGLTPPTLPR